jgi:capsular polysaccharide transport system ATP-binding protein
MIEIKNLYKRYHNHHGSDWVLKDINLTIPTGVSVGLIGANGAGKSTLLRLIAGMDTPERGEVIRHSRVSWPVGLSGGMQGNMTGRQNVKFVARVQGSGPEEVKRVIQFVEDFAEIGSSFDEPIRTYSSGMKSRISFGLSLAFDFDVYISDEATAVGDRTFRQKAQRVFKDKVGTASLIIVSHSEGIIKDLCDAGVYLKNGKAIWYDSVDEAITSYHMDTDDNAFRSIATRINSNDFTSLSKESVDNAKKELKHINFCLNGVFSAIKIARKNSWSDEELAPLKKVHEELKDKKILLSEGLKENAYEKYSLANNELRKVENMISGLIAAERLILSRDHESIFVFDSVRRLLHKEKLTLETHLDDYD